MNFSSFLSKTIVDLLSSRRIVVWFDPEGDFREFVQTFQAPNCKVLQTEDSTLKTLRRADEIYRLMNESDDPSEANRCMLIYLMQQRGSSEDERRRDPFEVFAIGGTGFGDTEAESLESLSRQAMPSKADEITRLFREGYPGIALLDRLEKTKRWPLASQVFSTESPADVIAMALADMSKVKAVDDSPGCVEELLRLFETSVGFKSVSKTRSWKNLRLRAAQYILFSEFYFDLPEGAPDSLSSVPRAGSDAERVVYAACDRMRSDSTMSDVYMELAQQNEDKLQLPDLMPRDFDPGKRDTFPFEEHRLLGMAVEKISSGNITEALHIIETRRNSIWRCEAQRTSVWTLLERALVLLEASGKENVSSLSVMSLSDLVAKYTEGNHAELDRTYRLFETALTACIDDKVLTPVIDLCRKHYRESSITLQNKYLEAVRKEGWPPTGVQRQTGIFDKYIKPLLERRERVAYFLVDSLRYEMGRDLADALVEMGNIEMNYAAGVIPTVTNSGMAALMPGADGMLRLVEKEGNLVPAIGTRLLRGSEDRMKLLTETYGDRFFETTLDKLLGSHKQIASNLNNVELFVVRTQDPDLIAENLGAWRARKYLSDVIGDIASAVQWVISNGFNHVIIASDHGHMMLSEIPAGDVVTSPPGNWLKTKRRCRLGSGLSGSTGTVTFKAGHVGVQGDLQEVCFPIGFRVFSAGDGYFHGGMSLQETVVPVIVFQARGVSSKGTGKPEIEIRYRSNKFTSRVIGLKFYMQGDIFGSSATVRIEAFDSEGSKAVIVGEAADCDVRDEKTHEVTLQGGMETPVPVLLDPDFNEAMVEIRVSDPQTHVVWARHILKNAMLD